MTTSRRRAVLLFFAAITLTSVFMMIERRERWPFSDYHMYSGVADTTIEYTLVVGTTTAGRLVDLSFGATWPPFEPIRLTINLRRFQRSQDGVPAGRQRLLDAVRFLRDAYVARRRAASWPGPELRRIGICEARVDLTIPRPVLDRLAECRPIDDAWVETEAGPT